MYISSFLPQVYISSFLPQVYLHFFLRCIFISSSENTVPKPLKHVSISNVYYNTFSLFFIYVDVVEEKSRLCERFYGSNPCFFLLLLKQKKRLTIWTMAYLHRSTWPSFLPIFHVVRRPTEGKRRLCERFYCSNPCFFLLLLKQKKRLIIWTIACLRRSTWPSFLHVVRRPTEGKRRLCERFYCSNPCFFLLLKQKKRLIIWTMAYLHRSTWPSFLLVFHVVRRPTEGKRRLCERFYCSNPCFFLSS